MPLLTSMATLAGLGLVPMGDFESIATVTVGSGGASSIEFTSIPGTYQHLQVRGIARRSTGLNSNVAIQFNGNATSGDYAHHRLQGNGSTASASGSTSVGGFPFIFDTHANATSVSNQFGAVVVDILDYASTSKNKTVRSFGGNDMNGAGIVSVSSVLWMSTNAITSAKILTNDTWAQYTTFSLYGVRA